MKKHVWQIHFKWAIEDHWNVLPGMSLTREDARARVRNLRNIYSKKAVSFDIVKEFVV